MALLSGILYYIHCLLHVVRYQPSQLPITAFETLPPSFALPSFIGLDYSIEISGMALREYLHPIRQMADHVLRPLHAPCNNRSCDGVVILIRHYFALYFKARRTTSLVSISERNCWALAGS